MFTPLKTESPNLKHAISGYLTMSVPKGSNFVEYQSIGKKNQNQAIGYSNKGEGDTDLMIVWIST